MAASASYLLASGLLAVLAMGGLAACDSTQNKNERAKLGAARELASRKPQRVTARNRFVRVERVSLVRGRRSAAVVVDLRSTARKPLTDVPIAVRLRTPGGRTSALNSRAGLDWFQTHVPAIPAAGSATWVFTTGRRVAAGSHAVATVGALASPAISTATALPRISVSPSEGSRVVVENDSAVPQYGLQVYALAMRGRRYVAAGKAALEHLGTGGRKAVSVTLAGAAGRRPLRVYAIPTIFQ